MQLECTLCLRRMTTCFCPVTAINREVDLRVYAVSLYAVPSFAPQTPSLVSRPPASEIKLVVDAYISTTAHFALLIA